MDTPGRSEPAPSCPRTSCKPWFVEAGGLYVSIAHTEFPSKPSALVFVLIAPVAGMYCERPLVDAIYSVFEMNLMSSMFEDGSPSAVVSGLSQSLAEMFHRPIPFCVAT